MTKEKKKLKIGRWILLGVLIYLGWNWISGPIELNQKIEVKEGGSFYTFLNVLDKGDALKMKIYLKKNNPDFSKLSQGWYTFSGTYSSAEFVEHVLQGPEKDYLNYTVLEGWSIYDIDWDLSKKKLIEEGDYLAYVMNDANIKKLAQTYMFIPDEGISSLEGVLYPDTYYLDKGQNVLQQLVKLQLDTFQKKVWNAYQEDMKRFYVNIDQDYGLKFSWYDVVTLSSVVEKEERNDTNKPVVAGIFFNRLKDGMRLDADITLCYGLREPYETCTPEVIVRSINDQNNPYNTRVQGGLPPQPIANVSQATIGAVLNYELSKYYYYLHDTQGGIHYGKTVGEHGDNKRKYLN